uniref:Uncharacterized protein n=1 Tax=Solanum tuberosum TaxID=4113 RepID=M0ZH76_SOLTU
MAESALTVRSSPKMSKQQLEWWNSQKKQLSALTKPFQPCLLSGSHGIWVEFLHNEQLFGSWEI